MDNKKLLLIFILGIFFISFASASWWNNSWGYKKTFIINTSVSSTLTDFPALIIIDTQSLISIGKMNNTCKDLRVLNSEETTEYPYEIVNGTCNTTTTNVYTKISSLSSGNQTVYIYYGNPTGNDNQNLTAVWQNYSYVNHQYAVGTGTPSKPVGGLTSKGTSVNITTGGSNGDNRSYHNSAGTSANWYYQNTSSTHDYSAGGFYISVKFYTTGGATGTTYPFGYISGSNNIRISRCGTDSAGTCTGNSNTYWRFDSNLGASNSVKFNGAVGTGSYQTLSATGNTNDNAVWTYENGLPDNYGAITYTLGSTSSNFIAGQSGFGAEGLWLGYTDEVRVGTFNASADWVKAEYNQLSWNGSEISGLNLTLNNPLNNTINLINTTFNFTSSVVQGLLTNATLYLDGILNETFILSGTTQTTVTNKILSIGNHNYTVTSCSTMYGCTNSSTNIFSTRYFTIDNISYSNPVYETARTTLGVNITYLSNLASIDVILQYAGTNYTTINTGSGNNGIFTTTLDIPVINSSVNNTFYWWIQTVGDTTNVYTSSSYNQTITPLIFTLCNATYTNVAINFTYYNEITGNKINVSANPQTFQGTFNYWVGSGGLYKNYSVNNLNTTNSSYAFCIVPYNDSSNVIYVNSNIYYTAYQFSSGNYYLNNASLFNTSNNINLWLLPSSSATSFTITTYRGVTTFKNAYVTISKYFEGEGIYKTVSMSRTDSSGVFVVDLQLNKLYSFSYSKDGVSYGTIYKTSACSSTPCEMDIQLTQDTYDLFSGYYDTYAQNVAYNLYYNNTQKMVYASFNDLTGLAVYFRLVVLPSSLNETQTAVCDVYSYSTSGTLSCNMTGYTGDYVAKLYISRSPEKLVHLIGFVANTIQENIGTVALFISLIFLLVIVFSGMRNPSIAVALVPIALVVLKLMDFNPLSWLTISAIAFLAILLIGRLKT